MGGSAWNDRGFSIARSVRHRRILGHRQLPTLTVAAASTCRGPAVIGFTDCVVREACAGPR
eukprot:2861808-Pyramimonas_sp.AAC.1